MSIAKHISQVSELKQAERLRQLIKGEWPLEHADRELLIGILDQWIGVLEDENRGGAA